jgi:hypothetical protein
MSVMNYSGRLRMVVFKNPFSAWVQPQVNVLYRDLFYDMVGMKLRGYGHEYPDGVLPVDSSDFIATHLLICQESKNGKLLPITGFKTTLLHDCEHHQISFPGLGLVHAAESPSHVKAMKAIMERCLAEGKSLAYTGSWTIEPILRRDKELSRELVQLFRAIYVFHHQQEKIDEVITGGTIRFKADVLLGNMGHDPLRLEDRVLPPIHVKHLFGEPVSVLHLKAFSDSAITQSAPYKNLWKERIEISADSGLRKRIHRIAG